jgi:F0F1-type ATP synthase delta subunit
MSFSADPSASFIERLMAWLRQEINPYVLVSVGLQPNIGAGCVVRSTNRQFDFSLRQDFLNKRDLLMNKIIAGQPETQA